MRGLVLQLRVLYMIWISFPKFQNNSTESHPCHWHCRTDCRSAAFTEGTTLSRNCTFGLHMFWGNPSHNLMQLLNCALHGGKASRQWSTRWDKIWKTLSRELVFPEEEGRCGDRSTTRAGALVELGAPQHLTSLPSAPLQQLCAWQSLKEEESLQKMICHNGFPSEPEQPGMLKVNFSYRFVVHFAPDHDKNFFPCQQQTLPWILFFFKTISESLLRKQMCSRG